MERRNLRFAYGETRLGIVLAAVGNKGLAAVLLGDSRDRLHREFVRSFAGFNLLEGDETTAEILAQVVSALNAPGTSFELPLDMRGSEIEVAVWQALRRIPVGETRSYGQIANELPIAATAKEVGAACAANILAVVIPCHRVVKADGSISGYRWGVSRKRQLIEMERAA